MTDNEERFLTASEDEIERDFLTDYAHFGAQLNAHTIVTLLDAARSEDDAVRRKILCTSCLQLLAASLEDFAALLQAIVQRKTGPHIHVTLTDGQGRGTTAYPAKLKRPESATTLMEELAFSTINVDRLQELGYEITAETFDKPFMDFAKSIKILADDADRYNDLKNRLKHGKCVFANAFGLAVTDYVGHIETRDIDDRKSRGLVKTNASLQQAEVATILVCKIAIVSLDLLALFAIHYHSSFVPGYLHEVRREGKRIVLLARGAGLQSNGLTTMFPDET